MIVPAEPIVAPPLVEVRPLGAAAVSSETLKREYRMLLLDYPDGFVEVNDQDARDWGIRDGQKIRLQASGGSAVVCARVTSEVRNGTILVPFFVRELERQIRGETTMADAAGHPPAVYVRAEKV